MFNHILKEIYYALVKHLRIKGNVKTGKRFIILQGSLVNAPNGLEVGHDVYVGRNSSIICDGYIGNYVMISDLVGLIGKRDHNILEIGVPIRYSKWIGESAYVGEKLKIHIEDDVWIGFGSILLSGIKIGRGAVIGAGSLVLHDVEPYSVVAGQPAKEISKRFSTPNQINEHELKIKDFIKNRKT